MTRTARLAGVVLAGLFLALHLPFLPSSLEDLDSINFALGIRDYDVARHQPHPPGYPIFIAAAKLLHGAGLTEVRALTLLGVVAGALGALALVRLYARFDGDRPGSPLTWAVALLTIVNPLYWLTASRPLSDLPGLAASVAIQALTLSAATPQRFALACGAAACAAGIRSQVVWLTVPLLVLTVFRLPAADRLRSVRWGTAAYVAGGLLWFVPLVVVSGGLSAYLAALSAQGAEDLSGVTMLATTPTVRQLARSLQYALLAPWGYWQMGTIVVVLALAGAIRMWRVARPALCSLLAAFGPYFAFDLLFQETVTTRYALPLVVPATYLAGRGLSVLSEAPAVVLTAALAASCVVMDDGAIARYARADAPAFRMLGDWANLAGRARRPVLAMHRREDFDLRRPLQWGADRVPAFERRLPATAKHEWLEVVKYWNAGGSAPVWFVADPLRSDLALIHAPARPVLYRWGIEPSILLGGSRPSEMDWYVFEAPDWYLGEGWALTPETAGIANEDGRGPGYAPIEGWIRRPDGPLTLMIGGRNLTKTGTAAEWRVEVDGQELERASLAPGFFLKTFTLAVVNGRSPYVPIRIASDSRDLAIEQFDAQPADRVVAGFAEGWHEQEYNPSTGVRWRWSSERAVLRVHAARHAVALSLRGEIEEASRSHVTIRAGASTLAAFDVERVFERTVVLPANVFAADETDIIVESSASYVPAETRWRSADRRRLGLRLFECRLSPAS